LERLRQNPFSATASFYPTVVGGVAATVVMLIPDPGSGWAQFGG